MDCKRHGCEDSAVTAYYASEVLFEVVYVHLEVRFLGKTPINASNITR